MWTYCEIYLNLKKNLNSPLHDAVDLICENVSIILNWFKNWFKINLFKRLRRCKWCSVDLKHKIKKCSHDSGSEITWPERPQKIFMMSCSCQAMFEFRRVYWPWPWAEDYIPDRGLEYIFPTGAEKTRFTHQGFRVEDWVPVGTRSVAENRGE